MALHGGRFVNYYTRDTVTHIICSNLTDAKVKIFERERCAWRCGLIGGGLTGGDGSKLIAVNTACLPFRMAAAERAGTPSLWCGQSGSWTP